METDCPRNTANPAASAIFFFDTESSRSEKVISWIKIAAASNVGNPTEYRFQLDNRPPPSDMQLQQNARFF
jgi:hypothetical protein